MIRRISDFFRKLIQSDSEESSKRFIAVFTSLILVSYLVIRYANKDNCEIILAELLGFVLVLMGVASWQSVKKHRKDEV